MKVIRCECGYMARGDNDDQVVELIKGHLTTDHPAVLASVSKDDMLSWVQTE